PKRIGNIYNEIISIENLIAADQLARTGKRYTSAMRKWDERWSENINRLHWLLKEQAYQHGDYQHFTTCTEGKERYISVSTWQDRIVHKAFCLVCEPLLNAKLSHDTFANIKGRGQHLAAKRLKKIIQANTQLYCLKMDIRKFYPSVKKDVMIRVLNRYVKDKKALWLAQEIVSSSDGLPIGNLTSQLFGNLVLDKLDRRIRTLGAKYLFRYCDDIVVLDEDKAFLHYLKRETDDYATGHGLEVKRNWQVFPVDDRGIDFLTGRIFSTHTRLRKRIKIKCIRQLRRFERHAGDPEYEERWWASVSGHLMHANTKHLIKKWKHEYPNYFERLRNRKAARASAAAQRREEALATKLQHPAG
ncbi:MAG: reverse transcriptase domain-containing protein, partial [Bacteroidales bacterium]